MMVAVPAGFVATNDEATANIMARRVLEIIEGWATTPPPGLNAQQSAEFSRLLNFSLRSASPSNVAPSTMGELMADTPFDAPTNPGETLPSNLGLVIYLNPNRNSATASTRIYRGEDVYNRNRSGLPIIEIGTRYFEDFIRYGQGSLASSLAFAGQVAEGTAGDSNYAFVNEVASAIAYEIGAPPSPSDNPSETSFTQTDFVDRAGLEMEVSAVNLTRTDLVPLRRTLELASTSSTELGIPVFKLTVDVLTEGGPRYPELVVAPLTSQEHMEPELHAARQILLSQLKNTSNTNVAELIYNYNAELITTLGDAGYRYYLNQTYEDAAEVLLTRRSNLPLRYSNQITFLVPYDNLGSDAFIDSLPITLNRTQVRALRTRAAEFITALGIANPSPEMRAFAFHLFFNTYQRKVAGV
ncbi:MAG: hypothetical protein MI747_04355, partial [Desulfobacterales bacterium]|nr:hypothetical protein [Desulfobacterales bacterium]